MKCTGSIGRANISSKTPIFLYSSILIATCEIKVYETSINQIPDKQKPNILATSEAGSR